jgi:DNA-binding PucR family transcriptional regulator
VRSGLDPGELAARLGRHGPVGLSELCADPGELGRAMESAALALDLSGAPSGVTVADQRVLREHYMATVAPLVRYDEQYATALVATVERVLAGDVVGVAAELGLPEHRIRYRLEKAHELTGLDATAPAGRRALGLGLRCHRVLGPALPA